MTRPGTGFPQWAMVDEGWGRKAVDFATLSELGNCREYVAMHHRLGGDAGDRLLHAAWGSGPSIQRAPLPGASSSGPHPPPRPSPIAPRPPPPPPPRSRQTATL